MASRSFPEIAEQICELKNTLFRRLTLFLSILSGEALEEGTVFCFRNFRLGKRRMGVLSVLFLLQTMIKNEKPNSAFTRQEIELVRTELQRLRSILLDVDGSQEGEEEIKLLLQHVREMIQDFEDVFDELSILHSHNHGDAIFHKISCCIKNMKARYRLRSDLREIHSRIGVITKELKRQEDKLRKIEQASQSKHVRRQMLENSNLVGIDGPKQQLMQWLIHGSSDREVISLAAMGGMGKTTLARQVYDDPEVKKHFQTQAWITVSQSFEEQELLIDMVRQLYQAIRRRPPKDLNNLKEQRLKQIIMDLLSKGRYLVVLDDIWELNEWNDVQCMLPNNKNSSRVMLTTRKNDIAYSASVGDLQKVYILESLPRKESWQLFCNQTFRGNEECPPYLEGICNDIIGRCEGLPLAIVAIGGVLATKSRDIIAEWHMVFRSLGSEINGLNAFNYLKRVLLLSFNDLPYYLKFCFLYISVFPEDHLIDRAQLIRLWIAEGFVVAKEGKTLEDVGNDYFKELVNRNLIQPVRTSADGRVQKCRIHDLLRDIIIAKSRDQNVAMVARDQNLQWPGKIRRLSIHNTQQNVEPNQSVSRLRSLFMFGVKEKPCMNALFPDEFRLLKVVDLQSTPLKRFPVELRDLSLLKYLSLRNTQVKTIPSFIGDLKNLETLDLKHSFVSELPIEISNLQWLRHILVYRNELETFLHFHTKVGFTTQANIGSLTSLQYLSFIEADKDGSALMEELGRLIQLRKLGILKLKKEDEKTLCSNIENLVNLRALSIYAIDENEIIDLQHLSSPPPLIQRLYLKGRMDKLPPWILSLHGLVRLHLTWTYLKDDPLAFLQDLPNLIHLELLLAFEGNTLTFPGGGFKKLKLLTIDEFPELQCLRVEKGAMPCVQKLNIQRCERLWRVPSGIEHLTTLQVLEFLEMPKELMETLHPDRAGNDYQKVAFIPEVVFTFWEDHLWKVQTLASMLDKNNPSQPLVKSGTQSEGRPK